MFDVISSGTNTQWMSFPTLCWKNTHPHVANEAVDFQVIPGRNCFAEFNKKSGFELLRTVIKSDKEAIQRIKKRQIDDLSCGAISKVCGSEIAIGMSNGFIRLFSVGSGDFMPFKFKPDKIGNSVNALDYSHKDEYLAAVYDSADVNLFGLKTGVKTDTFRFDGLSTFLRFHPAKNALAIGSYEGSVTLFDIQTKKKLFFDKTSHKATVRDISMLEAAPDLMISCSYDCNINVFDLRKRTIVQQHTQDHPMSSVCVSPCGTFCVAGNLKGDVVSYDFRNMKEALCTKRVHDGAVVRVAFVPTLTSGSNVTLEQSVNSVNMSRASKFNDVSQANKEATPENCDSLADSMHSKNQCAPIIGRKSRLSSSHSSFSKHIDVCHENNATSCDVATPKRRDSWADLMHTKQLHDFSMDSVAATPAPMSVGPDSHSELQLTQPSRLSFDHTTSTSKDETTDSVPEITVSRVKERSVIEPKRRRMTEVNNLEGIKEETSEIENSHIPEPKLELHKLDHQQFAQGFAAFIKKKYDEADDDVATKKIQTFSEMDNEIEQDIEEDKENLQNNQQNKKLTIGVVGSPLLTPNSRVKNADPDDGEMILVNVNDLNEILEEKLSIMERDFQTQLRKRDNVIMKYMSTKLKELTNEVRFMQGRYFQSDFNHRFCDHMELEGELAVLDECFAALLHTSGIDEQFTEYQAELEALQHQFEGQQF